MRETRSKAKAKNIEKEKREQIVEEVEEDVSNRRITRSRKKSKLKVEKSNKKKKEKQVEVIEEQEEEIVEEEEFEDIEEEEQEEEPIEEAEIKERKLKIEIVIPKKRPGRKSKHTLQLEKDNEINQSFINNKEEEYPIDDIGEKKIKGDGSLVGNRKYSIETFYLNSKPGKLFTLISTLIKNLKIKERSQFFRMFPKVNKISTTQDDREELFEIGLIPASRRSLPVNILLVKTAFAYFGHYIIIDGEKVKDDYYENPENSLCKEYENYLTFIENEEETTETINNVEQISEKTFIYESKIEFNNNNIKESLYKSCNSFNTYLNLFRNKNKQFYEPHTNLFHYPIKTNQNNNDLTIQKNKDKYPISLTLTQKQLAFPIHSTRYGHSLTENETQFIKKSNTHSNALITNNSNILVPNISVKNYKSYLNNNKITINNNNNNNNNINYNNNSIIINKKDTPTKASSPAVTIPPDRKMCGFYSKTTGMPCTYMIPLKNQGCRYHKNLPESERFANSNFNVTTIDKDQNDSNNNDNIIQNEDKNEDNNNDSIITTDNNINILNEIDNKLCVHCKTIIAPLSALQDTNDIEEMSENENSRPSRKRKVNREEIVICSECKSTHHLWCIQISDPIVYTKMKQYDWVCNECKKCLKCHSMENEDSLLICDGCDKPFHMACCEPPILNIPKGGWLCTFCEKN